jgi:hypothetical protein
MNLKCLLLLPLLFLSACSNYDSQYPIVIDRARAECSARNSEVYDVSALEYPDKYGMKVICKDLVTIELDIDKEK